MQKLKVILIGVIFLAVGIFMYVKGQNQTQNCTVQTVGTVVEITEEMSTDSDGDITYTYYPVIKYTADDKTVRKQYSTGSSNYSKYSINDKIDILYNPSNVEEYIIKGDNSSNIFGIIFGVVGILILLIGIIKKF